MEIPRMLAGGWKSLASKKGQARAAAGRACRNEVQQNCGGVSLARSGCRASP